MNWEPKEGTTTLDAMYNQRFQDIWNEWWVFLPKMNCFERQKDKFKIDILDNYDHMIHSVSMVRKEREYQWCQRKKAEIHWEYLD